MQVHEDGGTGRGPTDENAAPSDPSSLREDGRRQQRTLEDSQRRAQLERQRVQRDLEVRQGEAQLERQKAQRDIERKQQEGARERRRVQRDLEDEQQASRDRG